jgi:hypothetical protein
MLARPKSTPRRNLVASKKSTTHVIGATGAQYNAILVDRSARVLCGADLYYRERTSDRRGTVVSRLATMASNVALMARVGERLGSAKKCPSCFKLARMSLAEREAWRKQKAEAFAKLNEHNKAKRAAELAALDAAIDKARGDALTCLDAWHLGEGLPKRCDALWWANGETSAYSRQCALPRDHRGEHCDRDIDGNPIEPALDFDATLAMAIKAYKRENGGDAGQRLWMFKRFDDDDNAPAHTKREKISECKRVTCRFCNRTLGFGTIGQDFTRYVFMHTEASKIAGLALGAVFEGSALPKKPSVSDYAGFRITAPVDGVRIDEHGRLRVNVAEHTQLCALKYLGQVQPSVDPEIEAPSDLKKLPDQSFVLTLDEESDQP